MARAKTAPATLESPAPPEATTDVQPPDPPQVMPEPEPQPLGGGLARYQTVGMGLFSIEFGLDHGSGLRLNQRVIEARDQPADQLARYAAELQGSAESRAFAALMGRLDLAHAEAKKIEAELAGVTDAIGKAVVAGEDASDLEKRVRELKQAEADRLARIRYLAEARDRMESDILTDRKGKALAFSAEMTQRAEAAVREAEGRLVVTLAESIATYEVALAAARAAGAEHDRVRAARLIWLNHAGRSEPPHSEPAPEPESQPTSIDGYPVATV